MTQVGASYKGVGAPPHKGATGSHYYTGGGFSHRNIGGGGHPSPSLSGSPELPEATTGGRE